ncbi:MAG TPA: 3-hydroxyacyl-CoA dehydrogenase [Rhodocyclaceae bacterium]|nr:3-hydroxyacyl-CoA dehydrogenase [Rhodocyclaceae bacterium]
MRIQDGVFLVTGAASGLGAGVAQLLAEKGARLVLADLNATAGMRLAESFKDRTVFAQTNVADEASARAAVDLAISTFGRLDGLVNCAGIVHGEKVVGKEGVHALETFRRVIDINLVGTFNMIRFAAEAMSHAQANAEGERGVIVNTASVAAFEGQLGQAAYSASKGGIVAMTLPIARELARSGIRVMTIAPGIMETPMLKGMAQEVQDALGKMVPFPARLGRPSEFAALVAHIVENPYLNGEVIRLDGAIRMQPK